MPFRKLALIPSHWNRICIYSIEKKIPSKQHYYICVQIWLRYRVGHQEFSALLWESELIDQINPCFKAIKRTKINFQKACDYYKVAPSPNPDGAFPQRIVCQP